MHSGRTHRPATGDDEVPRRVIADGERLPGDGMYLRLVELSDCGDVYLRWLQDDDVTRFLETRWTEQSDQAMREFVCAMRSSPSEYLFAIVMVGGDRHVGNIKVGAIHPVHRHADVSYFIGEREEWGKGIASEAIRIATRFAFERAGVHRVQAVVHDGNAGSAAALERAGFAREGVFRQKLWIGDRWSDQIAYAFVRPESMAGIDYIQPEV
ncbi:MAG: GNAT family protein [Gemmatimonadaceae bacterium]